MRRNRVSFKSIAVRITGISTPVFGISWTPPKDQRDIVRRLVTFLEDRRALYQPYQLEYGPWVTDSVMEIRKELTEALRECPDGAEMEGPMRAMRAACRKFLDEVGGPHSRLHVPMYFHEAAMWSALGALRAVFGLHLARLCVAYGVDVEEELAGIMPVADDEEPSKAPTPRAARPTKRVRG